MPARTATPPAQASTRPPSSSSRSSALARGGAAGAGGRRRGPGGGAAAAAATRGRRVAAGARWRRRGGRTGAAGAGRRRRAAAGSARGRRGELRLERAQPLVEVRGLPFEGQHSLLADAAHLRHPLCQPSVSSEGSTLVDQRSRERVDSPSMTEPAYRRLQRDERRELLLARATELFAEHGYEGLSMSQLAREAQISKALLYHYFPSKRRLFEAALEEGAEELRARTEPDPGAAARRAARDDARRLPAVGAGAPGGLRDAAAERRRARCARSWPRSTRRPRRGSSPASARTGSGPRPGPRCTAGSASSTARSSTGSPTTTSAARSCTACCSARSPARSSPRARAAACRRRS